MIVLKLALNHILKETSYIYNILQYVFLLTYAVYILLPFPILIWLYIPLPFLNAVLYILYKDYLERETISWRVFLTQGALFTVSIPLYLIKLLEKALGSHVPILIKVIITLIAFTIYFAFILTDSRKWKEKFDDIKVKDTLSGEEIADNHDVKICIDAETGKEIYIKKKDRFLHLLILGPTGCGKTSQVLIPMILQDIQNDHGVIVLEPKSDLAVLAYAMSIFYGKRALYFNPIDPDCPYFNPLDGKESVVIENITTIFEMLSPDSITYYKDIANNLLRNAIRVLKRTEEAYLDYDTGISRKPATLLELNDLLQNTSNRGRMMVNEFLMIPAITPAEKKENEDVARYFLDVYYADRSVVWQNSSGVRTQVSNLINNEYLRRVLNPRNGKSDINFNDIVENEGKIFITTAQGALQNLNKYLGFFLMFSIQAAIMARSGNEETRKPCYWYLDEFQTYANSGLSTILQQGRSYRVSAILATQSRNAIKLGLGNAGDAFLSVVNTNARSQILFPGLDPDDAKYYSFAYGDEKKTEIQKGVSRSRFEFGHGLKEMNYPTEQERYLEKDMPRFTATKLTEKKFSEITYRRILDNNVTVAKDGISSFIDEKLNNELQKIAELHISEQTRKRLERENEIYTAKKALYTSYQSGRKSHKENETSEKTEVLGKKGKIPVD